MTALKTLSSDKVPRNLQVGAINPCALVEAIMGMSINQENMNLMREMGEEGEQEGPQRPLLMMRQAIRERGCSVLTPEMAKVISDTLQCDYDELFDMKHNSVLYAGLKLDSHGSNAEPIPSRDMHNLGEEDMITPDLSRIRKLSDLHDISLKDLETPT